MDRLTAPLLLLEESLKLCETAIILAESNYNKALDGSDHAISCKAWEELSAAYKVEFIIREFVKAAKAAKAA